MATTQRIGRAGIYVRVSLDRDGTSESPTRQLADCRALAAQRGLEIVEVYEERDRSAYAKRAKRPEYDRLLADLKAGHIDTVVFWKLDRLTRRGITGLGELLNLGAKLVSVHDSIDTTTAMGEGAAALLASVAKQESENISLRVKAAHRAAAERGMFHSGGPRPYGYLRNGDVVAEEAAIIREVAQRALDGESFRKIADDLNTRGVRSSTVHDFEPKPNEPEGCVECRYDRDEHETRNALREGRWWHSSVLANLVRSPRVAGLRTHKGDTYEGAWSPILSIDKHRRLVASKTEPRVLRRPYHLLAGIIYCGECGGKLKTMGFQMKNGKTFERYQCVKTPGQINCGRVAVTKVSTDALVKEELFKALSAGALVPGDQSDVPDEDELRQLLNADREALNELARSRFVDREITHDEYLAARAQLEERIASTEATLDERRNEQEQADALDTLRPGSREDLDAWWERADVHQRRGAVHAAVKKVVVHRAKRRGGNVFDKTRVSLSFNWPLLMKIADQADGGTSGTRKPRGGRARTRSRS